MDEWINKIWYIHEIQCFSSLKKEGHSDACINLENITLSEMSQTQGTIIEVQLIYFLLCYIYICFSHYSLLQDPECSCLCNTVGPCLFPM